MMARQAETILRFAIMSNGLQLQQWQYEVVNSLTQSGLAEPVALILRDDETLVHRSIFTRVLNYPWQKLLFRKYYQYLFRPASFKPFSISHLAEQLPVLKCRVEVRKKYSEYFSGGDLEEIRGYRPDFILKFGFGIIRGEILQCAPYGVWSFHHGDEQKYRGIPPAFYEILSGDPVTASILQRLTETLDGGIILRKGFFSTIRHSWRANLDQAIVLSKGWPLEVCREIQSQQSFPSEPTHISPGSPVYREPANYTFLVFLFRMFSNKVRFHFREIFLAEKWQTGLIKARPAEVVSGMGYTIDPEVVKWRGARGPDGYYADGFALKQESRLLLCYEDYDYRSGKAAIASVWFSERDSSFSKPVRVLEEDWHLSYPFLIRHEGQIYCIPESLKHGAVELYRFDPIKCKMTHVQTLLPEVAAADATLVQHQNRWYLFFTPAHATNTELHIWHSDLFEGPYHPHELNPVKSDITNARPAGPFFTLDGRLYRPAQDSSLTYGGRVIINEVKLLTSNSFLEMPVSAMQPPGGFSGLHTLSFAGDYLFFDCKKLVFSPASFLRQVRKRLGLVQLHKRSPQ